MCDRLMAADVFDVRQRPLPTVTIHELATLRV
jgi:hypothetical protein